MANSYNGWTNYNTWKINLEAVNEEYYREMGFTDSDSLAQYLESDIEELITADLDTDSVAYSIVVSFLSEVDWWEIADSILED